MRASVPIHPAAGMHLSDYLFGGNEDMPAKNPFRKTARWLRLAQVVAWRRMQARRCPVDRSISIHERCAYACMGRWGVR